MHFFPDLVNESSKHQRKIMLSYYCLTIFLNKNYSTIKKYLIFANDYSSFDEF